ncbi:unnamed protein product [Rotaria socialis]|uniref:Uncharacterized protein n=1 Tax=Rotaria socialis TaxID=392032 RepID=A0A818A7Q4_9BILA|nr:unnamed protein product [Rotaria socialis]CAF4540207.1 unnamed protein product [Rotaria socialis]
MDYDVFSPLALCKQKQRKILNKRNSRRRALTNVRRVLLDTTHAELSTLSSNHLDTQDENNLNTISNHLDSDYLYKNDVHSYELQNIHSSTDTVSFPFDEQASDDKIDISKNEQASDNLYECFNLSDDFTLPDIYLHSSTNLKKAGFCRNLLTLFRDAKVCKSHCDRFIQLIYSGLPVPNNIPGERKRPVNGLKRHKNDFNQSIDPRPEYIRVVIIEWSIKSSIPIARIISADIQCSLLSARRCEGLDGYSQQVD